MCVCQCGGVPNAGGCSRQGLRGANNTVACSRRCRRLCHTLSAGKHAADRSLHCSLPHGPCAPRVTDDCDDRVSRSVCVVCGLVLAGSVPLPLCGSGASILPHHHPLHPPSILSHRRPLHLAAPVVRLSRMARHLVCVCVCLHLVRMTRAARLTRPMWTHTQARALSI